jgi:hypothetical protein
MNAMSSSDEMRIGNDDRDAAQSALQQHLSEGRIAISTSSATGRCGPPRHAPGPS